MSRYQFPLPQHGTQEGMVLLKDGTTATLRPIQFEDGPLLITFLKHVSEDTRHKRFFGNVSVETATAKLLEPVSDNISLGLVVVVGDEAPQIVAHGEYRHDPDSQGAEVAFIVSDQSQGKGLGTLLLERLVLSACRQGINHFYADTETSNVHMREVFKTSGFDIKEDLDGPDVRITFDITPTANSVSRFELHERVATVASLLPFFKPRNVAVVGASRNPDSIGYRILENLIINHFNGPVYPVNPKAKVVGSVLAYPSVGAIPGEVDLAIITAPSPAISSILDDCGQKGVRAAIIISAGFAELGDAGRKQQEALVQKARGYGMRLIGPNCLGLLSTSPEVRLNASFSPVFPPHGAIAMSSQSGALGLAVLELARDRDLGLSSFVSLGNKADVSGNDLLQYWEDDPETKVILLYLESFGNPTRFARLARRVARSKPVLAVKAGRSKAGSKAASSHTAALAASETAVEALFQQTGIIRADTLEELFDVAALLANQPLPPGPRVGIVTNAGGPAILATDALEAEGLILLEPHPATKEKLAAVLPVTASLNNPVDMIASADASTYRTVVEAMLHDPNLDTLIVMFIPVGLATVSDVSSAIRQAVESARQQGNTKPVMVCLMTGQTVGSLTIDKETLPLYRFPEPAAKALGQVWRYTTWRNTPLGTLPELDRIDLKVARNICQQAQKRKGDWLSPKEVATLLQSFGLNIVKSETVTNADEAVKAAERIGYPVVVKIVSSTLLHKSEWQGVKLNLTNATEVKQACNDMYRRLEEENQQSALVGFLIQPMISDGTEVMIGVTTDPLFGPLIGFGLGGIHVEVLRDIVFRISPLTDIDANAMIKGIKGYRLLEGFRGAAPADINGLKMMLLRISRLVEECPEIAELDLNPIRARETDKGCIILDARIRLRATEKTLETI